MQPISRDEDQIGQETEEDLSLINGESFSNAVLWATDWTTETIVSQLKKGNIELSPNFQRRDAWGEERKSAFIESIILGLPIPQIILAERKDKRGSYLVIDGKQRLLSIRQYCVTEKSDAFNPLILSSLNVLKDLNKKTYLELSEQFDYNQYNTAFDNQSIRTVIIRNWPNQNFLYTVFLRLNTGSLPLSPQELRQALIPGDFTSFADNFSIESTQIRRALKIEKPDYRMRDVEVIVRYYAFKNFIELYSSNLKDFLDNACDLLNKKWARDNTKILQQAIELDNAINFTFSIFEENSFSKYTKGNFLNIFNRPVYDIMVYYFSIPEVRERAKGKSSDIVNSFKNLCDGDMEFLRSLEASTKSTAATAKRFNEWGKTLKSILQLNIPVPERAEIGIKLS